MERVGTLFFGSGAFALPTLRRLAEATAPGADRVQLRAVLTAPPRPAGRHGELQPTPVGLVAASLGLPILTPVSLRKEEILEQLRGLRAELIVLADYGRIIPPALLDLPRHGALNLHPSLLPRHRGAAPIPAAILAGDERTGISLMRMDAGMDTGPLIAQREVVLDGTEVTPALEARLADIGAALLLEELPAWLDGTSLARPQPTEGATLTRPLRRSDGWLDPSRSAVELERQVRAYQPWPGSFIEVAGERLIVWRAGVVAGADGESVAGPAAPSPDGLVGGSDSAGSIVPLDDGIALRASRGLLRLDEVQPAGRRRMSGPEYRRGRRV